MPGKAVPNDKERRKVGCSPSPLHHEILTSINSEREGRETRKLKVVFHSLAVGVYKIISYRKFSEAQALIARYPEWRGGGR